MDKNEISAERVPSPPGKYSRGISITNPKQIIFLSARGCQNRTGLKEQALEIYHDFSDLLYNANASWDDVAKIDIILKDVGDISKSYSDFNEARDQFYTEIGISKPYPASFAVIGGVPGDKILIEMALTAVKC